MSSNILVYNSSDLTRLTDLLGKHGYDHEKLVVENLILTVNSMDRRLDQAVSELQEMRRQIALLQDSGIRHATYRTAGYMETAIQDAKGLLSRVKSRLNEGATKLITAVRESGAAVLGSTLEALHVRQCFSSIKNACEKCEAAANRGSGNLTLLSDELHAAGAHMRNAGNVIAGKPLAGHADQEADRGVLHSIRRAFDKAGETFANMEQKAERALQAIDSRIEAKDNLKKRKERSAQRKPSLQER